MGKKKELELPEALEREVNELCDPRAGVVGLPGFSRAKVQSPHSKAHRDGWVTSQREGLGKGNQRKVELLKRARKGEQECRKNGNSNTNQPCWLP